jgi:cation diffusion facilitator CzcD-associated flavoprotein CzcO
MRIAVVGVGGTGVYFGGLLARAGKDVTFIARGARLELLRVRGALPWSRRWPGRSRFPCGPRTTRARWVPST